MAQTAASAPRRSLAALLAAAVACLLLLAGPARAAGCGDTWIAGSGAWSDGGSWSTGSPPTASQVACLTSNGAAGTYTVQIAAGSPAAVADAITVGGSPGNLVTLAIGSPGGSDTLTLTNAADGQGILATGAVTLGAASGDTGGPGAIVAKAGTLLSAGTVTSEPTGSIGLPDELLGGFDNAGTLVLAHGLTASGPEVSSGTITVDSGVTADFDYSRSGATFNQTGGVIDNQGTFIVNDGGFVGTAGTSAGDPLTLQSDRSGITVSPSGTGGDLLHVMSGDATLAGDIGRGYTLWASGVPGVIHGLLTVPTSAVNYGTLELGSADGTHGQLRIQGGVLSNDGTVIFENTHNGPDSLNGPLINNSTVSVQAPTNGNGQLTNNGTVAIAAGQTFSGTTFTQNRGATLALALAPGAVPRLALTGAVTLAGTLTTATSGTVTGSLPVITAGALSGRFGSIRSAGERYGAAYTTAALTLTGPAGVPRALARLRAVRGGAGAIRVTLSCPRSGVCLQLRIRGTVLEHLRGGRILAVSAGAGRRTVVLASATASLAAGQTRTILLTLNGTARRLLARWHRLAVRVAVSQATRPLGARTVAVTAPRRPRK